METSASGKMRRLETANQRRLDALAARQAALDARKNVKGVAKRIVFDDVDDSNKVETANDRRIAALTRREDELKKTKSLVPDGKRTVFSVGDGDDEQCHDFEVEHRAVPTIGLRQTLNLSDDDEDDGDLSSKFAADKPLVKKIHASTNDPRFALDDRFKSSEIGDGGVDKIDENEGDSDVDLMAEKRVQLQMAEWLVGDAPINRLKRAPLKHITRFDPSTYKKPAEKPLVVSKKKGTDQDVSKAENEKNIEISDSGENPSIEPKSERFFEVVPGLKDLMESATTSVNAAATFSFGAAYEKTTKDVIDHADSSDEEVDKSTGRSNGRMDDSGFGLLAIPKFRGQFFALGDEKAMCDRASRWLSLPVPTSAEWHKLTPKLKSKIRKVQAGYQRKQKKEHARLMNQKRNKFGIGVSRPDGGGSAQYRNRKKQQQS